MVINLTALESSQVEVESLQMKDQIVGNIFQARSVE
jgi:hypothetical protein